MHSGDLLSRENSRSSEHSHSDRRGSRSSEHSDRPVSIRIHITDEAEQDVFKDSHECTDIFWAIAFLLAMIVFCAIFFSGVSEGDLGKLVRGIDKAGQICGVTDAVKHKPVIYFCPNGTFSSDTGADLFVDTYESECVAECPVRINGNVTPPSVPNCTVPEAYESVTVMNRYCLPNFLKSEESHMLNTYESNQLMEDVMTSLAREGKNWPVLVVVTLMAIILGYFYLFLLRELAKCIIWLGLLALCVLLFCMGIHLWTESDETGAQLDAELGDVELGEHAKTVAHILAVIMWALTAAVMVLVWKCGQDVTISIICIQAGTDVIWHMPMLLLVPMLKGVCKVIVFLVLLFGYLMLLSCGEVSGTTFDRQIDFTPMQYHFLFLYVFFSFWIFHFITAWYQFSVAYAVAKYYHTEPEEGADDDERHTGFCTVGEGALIGITKHPGSLAIGSLMVAFLGLVQVVLEWAQRQSEQTENNPVIASITGCCLCCCRCCHEAVQFINKQVYITIAVTSGDFCHSIRVLSQVVMDFGPAMALLNGATMLFQLVGLALISVACGALGDYLFFVYGYEEPTVGVILSFAIGAVVAWSFMTMFDTATDTLLFCYAVDYTGHGHAHSATSEMKELFQAVDGEREHATELCRSS